MRLVSARGAGKGGVFLRWRQEEKVPNECSFFPKELPNLKTVVTRDGEKKRQGNCDGRQNAVYKTSFVDEVPPPRHGTCFSP